MAEKAGSTDKTMTQAEFSRHMKVSRATVTSYKKKGLLVMTDDGRIIVGATEEKLKESLDPIRGGDRSDKQPAAKKKGDSRFMDARTEEMEVRAARQKLALEQDAGLLVEKEPVRRTGFTLARTAQETFTVIPDRISSILAAESDAAEVHRLLSAEIRAACQSLAKSVKESLGQLDK